MEKTNRRQTELCAGEGESLSWVPVESQINPERKRADERIDRQTAGQRQSVQKRKKKKISKKKEGKKKKRREKDGIRWNRERNPANTEPLSPPSPPKPASQPDHACNPIHIQQRI